MRRDTFDAPDTRIVKRGRIVLRERVEVKYRMIARCRDAFLVRMTCRCVRASPSGDYYGWRDRPASLRKQATARWHRAASCGKRWNLRQLTHAGRAALLGRGGYRKWGARFGSRSPCNSCRPGPSGAGALARLVLVTLVCREVRGAVGSAGLVCHAVPAALVLF